MCINRHVCVPGRGSAADARHAKITFATVPRICLAASRGLLASGLQGHVGVKGFQLGGQCPLQESVNDLLAVVAKVLQGCCEEAIPKVW